ncbi:lipid A biosynthesis lauroyl acyltransferase [Gluconacetobacter liquefaciens]|uniref:KDO2-lipid IV(A) lauroyltransferase n=1 Tax=Gluconacetobacter liquefaciens TaxID=89584 RepID=A0A370G1A3_GLULI|nr:lauroyl acyltransferase [Gluconacetobacter liquefaciens]MBB2187418.1 lauroyl acyltransferase [Gluconacetobacter liquefaciens]RDI36384.1 KDO2-lipid IV(A) lauroyltransferase [Gluconacetobacter liquefaciens]GBR01342.1 lipid A biosynthesis lauroyl acyltransferase [Gluconacetobacter liquefaciens NRIC 0522]GEB37940.1 lipid A biosynthesis lauroyl acyltransferase [Gluconacetobacter liquefaciens]
MSKPRDETRPVTRLMRLEALAARAALALLRRLGPVGASNAGGAVCRAIGPRLPVSRIADANLRLAMPELDAPARRAVISAVWDNLGRTVGEFPHIAALPENPASGPGWDVVGAEHLAAQVARGGPVIFMSGHIGNWEMLPPGVARHGLPFASFYRAAGNPLVDGMIRALREAAMGETVPMFAKGARGARGALAHIARGGRLGMLVDQKMNDGIEATLFGHPAMTAPALAAMALRYRCPVIPGYVERLGPARLRIHVEPPLDLPDSGDRQADILTLTQAVNDRLEHWVRARPGTWLWLHRRWPKSSYS